MRNLFIWCFTVAGLYYGWDFACKRTLRIMSPNTTPSPESGPKQHHPNITPKVIDPINRRSPQRVNASAGTTAEVKSWVQQNVTLVRYLTLEQENL